MIEFKELSAQCPVEQRLKAVDLKVWARPGFNPHPSMKVELEITFVLLFLFF